MTRKWNKALALGLALCMCVGTMNVEAWANTEIVEVPAKANGEAIDVEIVIEEKENEIEISGETTEDGISVEVEGKFETEENDAGETELVNGEASFKAESSDGTYTSEGGYEISTEEKAPEVTVEVSLEEGEKNSAESEGSVSVSGDEKESETDGEYDYTQTTVNPGSVSVETTEITLESVQPVDENGNPINSELDYVRNEIEATEENDMFKDHLSERDESADASDTPIADGYEFVYVGTDNTSNYFPAIVFEDPLSEEELQALIDAKIASLKSLNWDDARIDNFMKSNKLYEERSVTVTNADGSESTYYLHRIDAINSNLETEGWYEDGEWKAEQNSGSYSAVYSTIHQFILVDAEGNESTVYCADQSTTAEQGFSYNIENLEDATYYSEDEAEMIRSIALNGYWGTKEGIGSLDNMKEMMRASGEFTEAEINTLTDGMALTATQCAIWSCSNKMSGVEFINMQYVGNPSAGSYPGMMNKNLDDVQIAEVDLILKLYDYLISMEPTSASKEAPTTADTIINEQNFLKNMDITVLKKAEDHENNQDNDENNDAYVTNLTFALVVAPSTENGDDLVVSVVDGDGNTVAKGRIAGQVQDGETMLIADKNGNYTFSNITLVEGQQNFNISLTGIQNLDEGVYLYTSEVKDNESSQTFVGLASGQHAVGVSMNLEFNLSVDDEIVVTERQWRDEEYHETTTEYHNDDEDEEEYEDIPDEPVPLSDFEDIFDEEVPLANVPQTGANNSSWSMMAAAAILALAAALSKKNR